MVQLMTALSNTTRSTTDSSISEAGESDLLTNAAAALVVVLRSKGGFGWSLVGRNLQVAEIRICVL